MFSENQPQSRNRDIERLPFDPNDMYLEYLKQWLQCFDSISAKWAFVSTPIEASEMFHLREEKNREHFAPRFVDRGTDNFDTKINKQKLSFTYVTKYTGIIEYKIEKDRKIQTRGYYLFTMFKKSPTDTCLEQCPNLQIGFLQTIGAYQFGLIDNGFDSGMISEKKMYRKGAPFSPFMKDVQEINNKETIKIANYFYEFGRVLQY